MASSCEHVDEVLGSTHDEKFSKIPASTAFSRTGLSNAAPMIYFPGALLYSAGFNVNQNLKKKYF
jgi:hypothetical protein